MMEKKSVSEKTRVSIRAMIKNVVELSRKGGRNLNNCKRINVGGSINHESKHTAIFSTPTKPMKSTKTRVEK